MPQDDDFNKRYAQVIAKAWSDADFKQRLISEPAVVLQEHGIQRPDWVRAGAQIRVVENSDDIVHLVLPPKPSESLLSDEQLSQVVGGVGGPGSSSYWEKNGIVWGVVQQTCCY